MNRTYVNNTWTIQWLQRPKITHKTAKDLDLESSSIVPHTIMKNIRLYIQKTEVGDVT